MNLSSDRRADPAIATGGFGFIQCLIGGIEERRDIFDGIFTLGHANTTGHVKRRAVLGRKLDVGKLIADSLRNGLGVFEGAFG